MIYSRFGSEVEIISGDVKTGLVTCRYVDDGQIFDTTTAYLKADNGLGEIVKAIEWLSR